MLAVRDGWDLYDSALCTTSHTGNHRKYDPSVDDLDRDTGPMCEGV